MLMTTPYMLLITILKNIITKLESARCQLKWFDNNCMKGNYDKFNLLIPYHDDVYINMGTLY